MNLPTVDEVIQFAKDNNFKFQTGSIGNPHCGCAITVLALMNNGPVNGYESYKWFRDQFDCFDVTRLWYGFDNIKHCVSFKKDKFYNFGCNLREAVTAHNLWDETSPHLLE